MAQTREQILAGKISWQKANTEKARAAAARYRVAHPERWRDIQKKADAKRVRDPDERRSYLAEWREKNRERTKQLNRDWAANNPEKVKAMRKRRYAVQGPYLRQYFATHKETRLRSLLTQAKARAKRNGIPFDLSYDDIVWPEACPALGIRLNYEFKNGKRGDDSPSLDRLIPSLGYTKGNVTVMSWRANRIKCDATIEEAQMIAAYMLKTRSN